MRQCVFYSPHFAVLIFNSVTIKFVVCLKSKTLYSFRVFVNISILVFCAYEICGW